MDENLILKNHKDVDTWFETEKKFLDDYHFNVNQTTRFADKVTKTHKRLADAYIGVAAYTYLLPVAQKDPLAG
jgi:sorting nexin-5/6/32